MSVFGATEYHYSANEQKQEYLMDIAYGLKLHSSYSVWKRIHELCLPLCSFGLVYKSLFMSAVSSPIQDLGRSTQSYK